MGVSCPEDASDCESVTNMAVQQITKCSGFTLPVK